MDLDDELPRIQTSAAGMKPPCGSEKKMNDSGNPGTVTEDLLGSVTSAEQAVSDRRRKAGTDVPPKKADGTDDAPGGMDLLGSA